MRRHFLLLLSVSLCALGGEPLAAESRPNLIWIMADDLGYGDLGCYGQKVIKTPRLDRMAAEGMRFTHFYAGATVCAPSRSVLMTGLHHGHTRVRGNAGKDNPAAQALKLGDVTVAAALQKAGYAPRSSANGASAMSVRLTPVCRESMASTSSSATSTSTTRTITSPISCGGTKQGSPFQTT
jgi:hypothetical protein